MEELWKILRDNPKWNEKHVAPKRKRNVEVPSPQGVDGTPQLSTSNAPSLIQPDSEFEQIPGMNDDDDEERPEMGRKKSKEKKKKGTNVLGPSPIIKEFIEKFDASVQQQLALSEKEFKSKEEMRLKEQELKERLLQQKEEILRQHAQQLNVKEQKLRQKQWLEEKEILVKDLREMEHSQVEIFRKLQQDIWEKWQREGTLP
ncbi:hypothetical protein LguiA_028526 [Lonicera macranthoides]